MFDEEEIKRKKTPGFQNLEFLSVQELEEYIKTLEGEIDRVRGDIERKKASQAAAASVFKV